MEYLRDKPPNALSRDLVLDQGPLRANLGKGINS